MKPRSSRFSLEMNLEEGGRLVYAGKTHGRHGIAHFILGSVAEHVVRESPCPVLTLTSAAKERYLAP
jgi:hypothetical protein